MLKRVAILICAVAVSASAHAQQTKAAAAPPKKPVQVEQPKPSETKAEAPAAKPVSAPIGQPVNVRIEISITDQTGANPPAKKVVTMIAGDNQPNSIRSSASVRVPSTVFGPSVKPGEPLPPGTSYTFRNVTINVDARPSILTKEPNKIQVNFGLEYQPRTRGESEELEAGMAALNERITLILESGKPMLVSQAADPTSDRKITVEVTATILK